MTLCPCGSQHTYSRCCEIAHLNHSAVTTPEQLMRSRYSAHVLGLVDYVVDTYHPSCHAEEQRDGIADSIDSHWVKLEVVDRASGRHEHEGFVEFNAYFEEEGKQYCLSERSRFIREDDLWYYIDGEFPQDHTEADEEPTSDPRLTTPVQSLKVGRNDPCICGSGKKFKKCCG